MYSVTQKNSMTTITLRKKIHECIDDADEQLLDIVYRMLTFHQKIPTTESVLSPEQKLALEQTLSDHKEGKMKYYTVNEAKEQIYGEKR